MLTGGLIQVVVRQVVRERRYSMVNSYGEPVGQRRPFGRHGPRFGSGTGGSGVTPARPCSGHRSWVVIRSLFILPLSCSTSRHVHQQVIRGSFPPTGFGVRSFSSVCLLAGGSLVTLGPVVRCGPLHTLGSLKPHGSLSCNGTSHTPAARFRGSVLLRIHGSLVTLGALMNVGPLQLVGSLSDGGSLRYLGAFSRIGYGSPAAGSGAGCTVRPAAAPGPAARGGSVVVRDRVRPGRSAPGRTSSSRRTPRARAAPNSRSRIPGAGPRCARTRCTAVGAQRAL